LKEEIESFVPEGRQWLVKTSWTLVLNEFWRQAYPDALWILPYRSARAILDSMKRHPGMRKRSDRVKLAFIKALQIRQSEIKNAMETTVFEYHDMEDILAVDRDVKNSLIVDVKKVSQKDEEEIERFFNFVNIPINWEAVNKWIEPERMK